MHIAQMSFSILIAACTFTAQAAAQSSVYKSSDPLRKNNPNSQQAIIHKRPIFQDDSKITRYDIALCAETLSKQANSHYRFQPEIGRDGRSIKSANLENIDILGKQTVLQFQPSPAQQSTTTKTTSTATTGTTTTETITTKSQNSPSLTSATPITVALDHTTGLMRINGQIPSQFEAQQLQETCRNAVGE